MRHLTFIIILLIPLISRGQIDKTIYNPYFKTADSIITLYYGQTKFDKFIKLDSSKGEFLVLHSFWDNRAYFDKPLDFKPNVFQFQYLFTHPKLFNDTFTISFLLDSSRQLMTGFNPSGLFNCATTKTLNFITKDSALSIAKKAKIKKPIKNYEIEIGWEETKGNFQTFKKTNDIRDLVNGRIVWRVKSEFRKAPEMDEKSYAQVYIIDALTGRILSEELPYIDWD